MNDKLLAIYKNSVKSRYLDERLQQLWNADGNKQDDTFDLRRRALTGAVGNELGQSVIAVLLEKNDSLIPRYRGYAAQLGKGMPVERIVAEALGKKTGASKGIGGSASFKDAKLGIFGYSTFLGSSFSIAIGLALSKKIKNEPGIVVQFFGDGEASRTTFGSTLNLAALWQLPLLLVCENDGISMESSIHEMSSTKTISERAKGYNIEHEIVYTTEPLNMYKGAEKIITKIRIEGRPALFEIVSKRFAPHSFRTGDQPFLGAMLPKNEDPLAFLEEELSTAGITKSALLTIEQEAMFSVDDAIKHAGAAESLTKEEFFDIFHD